MTNWRPNLFTFRKHRTVIGECLHFQIVGNVCGTAKFILCLPYTSMLFEYMGGGLPIRPQHAVTVRFGEFIPCERNPVRRQFLKADLYVFLHITFFLLK